MDYKEQRKAFESARDLIKIIDGLSDEGFEVRFLNDPAFNKGVKVIADLYLHYDSSHQPEVIDKNYGLINNAEHNGFGGPFGKR